MTTKSRSGDAETGLALHRLSTDGPKIKPNLVASTGNRQRNRHQIGAEPIVILIGATGSVLDRKSKQIR